MSPIVVEAAALGDVVGVVVFDEIQNLFAVFFLVLALVLVVDLGFDIEECVSAVLQALAAVALSSLSARAPPGSHCTMTHSLNILVLVFLLLFVLLIITCASGIPFFFFVVVFILPVIVYAPRFWS